MKRFKILNHQTMAKKHKDVQLKKKFNNKIQRQHLEMDF